MVSQDVLSRMKAPGDERPHIWRGRVLQVKVTNACDLDCRHCSVAVGIAKKLKRIFRMTPDQFRTALRSLKGFPGVIGMFGGNPSCAAGTRVFTSAGIFPIEDLEDRKFTVHNLHGEESPAFCRLSGRDKPLYEVKLRGGHSYFATAEHEWPAMEWQQNTRSTANTPKRSFSSPRKLRTTELKPGMRLPIIRCDSLGFGKDGDREDGFLAGWLLGDGWIINRKGRGPHVTRCRNQYTEWDREFPGKLVRGVGLIVNQDDHASGIADRLSDRLHAFGSDVQWRAVRKCHELHTASTAIEEWMIQFGIVSKAEGIPAAVWSTASEGFRIGFIDGLFSSDGSVEVTKTYTRIRLTTAHKKLADDVSDLLGFYGIKTSVHQRVRKGNFPNGKDYGKDYTSYDVSVSGYADVKHFAKLFPLTHGKKNARLQSIPERHSDCESTNIEIESVELTDRREDVWDISVGDGTHCFQIAHCITGNCIHPHFEELCEIFQEEVPDKTQRGLWSNNLFGHGRICRETFHGPHSNINVHEKQAAWDELVRDWPEATRLRSGLDSPSTHGPIFGSPMDLGQTEEQMWQAVGSCYVNQTWSAEITVVNGILSGYFCEIAATMAELEGDPDFGEEIKPGWWKKGMPDFEHQVNRYCPKCLIPMNGRKVDAKSDTPEEYTKTWAPVMLSVKGRKMQQVESLAEIAAGTEPATKYLPHGVGTFPVKS